MSGARRFAGGTDAVLYFAMKSVVFAGSAGHLFRLDAQNGQVLWHNSLKGLGHNDVTLAMNGISVQFLTKVEKSGGGNVICSD